LIKQGLNADSTREIMIMLGANPLSVRELDELMLYSETLPKSEEKPYTTHTRFLHFLWDMFDKLPLCLSVLFSIPFRRLIAENLFESCGRALICEENVRFNLPQFLRVGEGVFCNRGVFLVTKGGIDLGDFTALAENVQIFTHGHSESSHMVRSYSKVTVEPYAKIFSGVTILPGVTIGKEALVAANALVTKDVPPGMVVAGIPAKVIRKRNTEGRHGDELDHIWLF
jgi:acetyltransferase-like isoleucine patch superfamily enzyme